ncbi:GNAT family N-acetyltransferase [Thalassococcus lentus]|uniref:GNAT family N-acetyltransferase n=1 Tax=Thalassococcus lentus TaxID=1210524 RepID=A0ABT4XWR7_9RHOB|nr:GNAT family N-acetyltransferase [Thalassococcus lentus]MDA7426411.1 GNAT family N-acetyltransferase [Thalassococcus lentus]
MIRKATDADIPALSAFFDAHIESSMFLQSNLMAHGIGNTDHQHGTTYFLRENGDGIAAVLGATNGGMLMCQMPGLTKIEAEAWAYALQGFTLNGMTGDADQVALFLDALPLDGADWQINADQPLFSCEIAALDACDARIRAVTEQDAALLSEWIPQYLTDSGLAVDPVDPSVVTAHVNGILSKGTSVVLLDGPDPVALSGLNAMAGRAVQVGGVFVPRERRGQGFAGAVVAGHLASLASQGYEMAILFAASDVAASAYKRIGFQPIGAYRVALLSQPVTLGVPA